MSAAPIVGSPWLKIEAPFDALDAVRYSRHGRRLLYNAINRGELRAVRLGGRGKFLTTAPWLDEWLTAASVPVPIAAARRKRSA
jgi:hypothetical protein